MDSRIQTIIVSTAACLVVSTGCYTAHAVTYLSTTQAQKLCFPRATHFVSSDLILTPDQTKAIEKDSGVRVRSQKLKAWRAMADSVFLGWVIQDEVVGKHEFITWILALTPDGLVHQVEVLDYRENYGAEVRNKTWRDQFVGKGHGAKLKLDDDIRNVSGATLSCRHITDGVKRLLSTHAAVLAKEAGSPKE